MDNNKTKCFLISSNNINNFILKNILNENHIDIADLSFEPGLSINQLIEKLIKSSDFVCAMINKNFTQNNYFELGLARGMNKPIFIIYEPDIDIPHTLKEFPNIKANENDYDAISFNLNVFIDNLNIKNKTKKISEQKRIPKVDKKFNYNQFINKIYQIENESEIIENIEHFLSNFNHITSVSNSNSIDKGIDLAIWIDELQKSIQNPLLIEFKKTIKNDNSITKIYSQMNNYLNATNSNLGLVLYKEILINNLEKYENRYPLILFLSLEKFIQLIATNELTSYILNKRNTLAHKGGING